MTDGIFIFHFTCIWTGRIPIISLFLVSDDIFYRTPLCLYFPSSFFFFLLQGENETEASRM